VSGSLAEVPSDPDAHSQQTPLPMFSTTTCTYGGFIDFVPSPPELSDFEATTSTCLSTVDANDIIAVMGQTTTTPDEIPVYLPFSFAVLIALAGIGLIKIFRHD